MRALLDLRRETAVSLPALDPGESIDELGGTVLRYPVAMVALGHYDGLVRFLDGLEAWQAPMTWELTAMTHDELGTRTKLAIDFLSYRSPTVDSPALRVALAAVGSQEGHDERLAAYVAALPPLGRRDRYQPPETVPRDPFVDPATAARMAREDEEGASGR